MIGIAATFFAIAAGTAIAAAIPARTTVAAAIASRSAPAIAATAGTTVTHPGLVAARFARFAGRAGVFEFLAGFLIDQAHRQANLAARIDLEHLDLDRLAFGNDVAGRSTRSFFISETWTRPSLPPMKFTKAPKSTMLTTLPL